MTKKTLRVGIIGFGMIGKVHAYGYAALPYYAEPFSFDPKIVRVVTSSPETAELARRTINCEFAGTDYREITENPEIDVVHICSPNDRHREALLSAIRANKAIYCDKPLSLSVDEAEEIETAYRATDASGRRLYRQTTQMTFHLRFYPAIRRAKELIEAGRLGRIFHYQASYYHASNAKQETPFKWKQGPAGGVLRDLAPHLLDLVDYLIGSPSEILAESQVAFDSRPLVAKKTSKAASPETNGEIARRTDLAEDHLLLLTRGRTPGDRSDSETTEYRGIFEATKLATGYEDEVRLEIHGEKGAIRFSLMDPHYLEFFDALLPDRPWGGDSGWTRIAAGDRFERPDLDFPSAKASIGWVRGHIASLSNFLRALERGEPGNPNLLQGVKIQKILDVAARSARDRSWKRVDFR